LETLNVVDVNLYSVHILISGMFIVADIFSPQM